MPSVSPTRSRVPQSTVRALSARPLILSLGDPLSVEAVRLLRATLGNGEAEFLDGGRMGLTLLHHLRWHAQIAIIDTLSFGGRPGDILRLKADDLSRFVHGELEEHQALLLEVLQMLEAEDLQPREFYFYAVQKGSGTEHVVPQLVSTVAEQIQHWRHPVQAAHA
jgi:hydrogenase maturation protease